MRSARLVKRGVASGSQVNAAPRPTWRELATDWRLWLWLAVCLLVATIAWLLGYD
jgi:hypothetical protein